MDFVSDALLDGRRFRALTVVDDLTKESPAIEVGQSLTGLRVVRVLERLALTRGLPEVITMDNGPEFTSKALGTPGPTNKVSGSASSSRASPYRTPSSKASMAASGTNV